MTSASSGSSSGTPNAVAAARIVRASSVELSAAAATQTPTLDAGDVQVAGDDEPVAPVVARPAQHAHRDAVAIALAHGSGRLRAGTFHQRDAGQPELADCTPVELTYLFRVP